MSAEQPTPATSDQRADLGVAPCLAEARNAPGECVLVADHAGRHQDAEGQEWKGDHKYGRPDLYEITWTSGHIETVVAHQITFPNSGLAGFGGGGLITALNADTGVPRIRMHAEINGRWCLTLQAREEDIRTMRLVTDAERLPGGES